jgi:hypothetical protein
MYYSRSFHWLRGIIITSLYTFSKSIGLRRYNTSQLMFERILTGTIVYFYDITIIETIPFTIRCLLLKKSCESSGLFSFALIYETTSSITIRIFAYVRLFYSAFSFYTYFWCISSTYSASTYFVPLAFLLSSSLPRISVLFSNVETTSDDSSLCWVASFLGCVPKAPPDPVYFLSCIYCANNGYSRYG